MIPSERKAHLRTKAIEARQALASPARDAATAAATDHAWHWIKSHAGLVGLYAAFRDEMDAYPLSLRLSEAGRRLALPFTPRGGKTLIFRLWSPGDTLITSKFGIAEPNPDQPEVFPDVLVVSPVAFDRRGYRIGYGAGFYDRTIPALRAKHPVATLGLAFACQETDQIPDEQHDVPLDTIATERERIDPAPTRPGLD